MRSGLFLSVIFVGVALSLATGCEGSGDLVVFVDGEVRGQPFSATSGVAEPLSGGGYVLTLSNSPSFSCTSGPTTSSLSVVLDGFSADGEYDADDRVSFNSIQDGVIDGDTATSGRFSVEIVEDGSPPYISGDITASGPESQVSGTFEVPICN